VGRASNQGIAVDCDGGAELITLYAVARHQHALEWPRTARSRADEYDATVLVVAHRPNDDGFTLDRD